MQFSSVPKMRKWNTLQVKSIHLLERAAKSTRKCAVVYRPVLHIRNTGTYIHKEIEGKIASPILRIYPGIMIIEHPDYVIYVSWGHSEIS